MRLYYDLHMHSCLSPCGDNDMTPNNIVNMALIKDLDVIALSDHNTAKNIMAVKAVASETPLLVLPGIEVNTSEEVHMLCLFEEFSACLSFGDYLYDLLPPISNKPQIFGEQLIMNQEDQVTEQLDKLLINAANLSIDQLLKVMPEYGGLAIPAHVDRSSYSIISNLGYIPEEYHFPCIEVKQPPFQGYFPGNILTNSDAHYLEDIAEREHFLEVEEKSVKAVLDAVRSCRCKESESD